MATFADRIKLYRTMHQLTQEDVARRIGVTKQKVSLFESSKQIPKIDEAAEIANALNLDLAWLIGCVNSGDGTRKHKILGELCDKAADLDEDQVKTLALMVDAFISKNQIA